MAKTRATELAADFSKAQLFVDDRWVADSHRVTRVWHRAVKYPEPVIRAEHPWEYNCPAAYGTVLHRDGLFRAWYIAWQLEMKPRVCYAESNDGVHWRKPALRLFEVCGTRENNVSLEARFPGGYIDDCTVIEDAEDRGWPLKMLYWDSGKPGTVATRKRPVAYGICAARSRDGLRWEPLGEVLPLWIDRFNAVSARKDGKFVVLGRAPMSMMGAGNRGRRVWRIESDDLVRWSEPRLVLQPDAEDPPPMQFYSAVMFDYESLTLGSIERMHMEPDKLDPELIFSRDGGWTWGRARTRPRFIEWGAPGTWDGNWLNLTTAGPVRRHNRLWFYYSGRSCGHGRRYPHNHGAIGLATLRVDGFCSLAAAAEEGWILTPELTWPGGGLEVNYDARRDQSAHPGYTTTYTGSGGLRVEVQDESGRPIRGFAASDCNVADFNSELAPTSYGPITWKGDRTMQRLRGRRIRLCFRMRDCHLYAFRAALST